MYVCLFGVLFVLSKVDLFFIFGLIYKMLLKFEGIVFGGLFWDYVELIVFIYLFVFVFFI